MGTARSGTAAPARRPLPANLSQTQRQALEQFMAGQISAGALSSKLDQAEPGLGGPSAGSDWTPRHAPSHAPSPRAPDSVTAERPAVRPAARRRLGVPVALVSAVLLATGCVFTVASASTSPERPGNAAAARITRPRHHRSASGTSRHTFVSASSTAGSSASRPAHHAKRHATPPGKAHGRGHGHKSPAAKLGAKSVAKPSGPTSKGGGGTSTGSGGTGSQPGGAPGAGNSSAGQSTTPSGTSTTGSGSGTTTTPAPSTGPNASTAS